MANANKFLIIGANGLIGQSIVKEIDSKKLQWIGTYYSNLVKGYIKYDINDFEESERIFENIKPTHVISCASVKGGLDFCEKNPDIAKKNIFDGTVNLGKLCLKYKCKLIFISTECVFDGKKEVYFEDDAVNPKNVYGKYKAESEKWIQQNLSDFIIVRTMSVYGWDPQTTTPNAIMQLYFSIQNGKRIFAPTFRWGNPTYVRDLAKAMVELILSKAQGIFHVAGATFINRYDWLCQACNILGWDRSCIQLVDEPHKDMIFRPLRIKLNTDKFRNSFKTVLHSLQEGLELIKREDITKDLLIKV